MKKFEMIYLDIEKKIQNNTYPINSPLPSEHMLSDFYEVSRETIRKVLALLEENGYIQKKHGVGSIVLDYKRFSLPISGLTSYKELQNLYGFKAETKVIQNKVVRVPKFLISDNDVLPDEEFIHLIRSREIDGEILIIDEDFIRKSIVDNIPNIKAEDSIYDYFEYELGLNISYARKEIRAEHPDSTVAEYMNITMKDYVINVKSHVYLEDTTFFQYTVSHHQLDKFKFSDFARRKHKLGES